MMLFLLSCKKEKSGESIFETCGYAPYSIGSTFDYQYVSGSDTLLYTLTVTGDTLLNGNRFSVLSSGMANQYIGCDNGRYYLFEPRVSLPDYEIPDGFRLFLLETTPVGRGWSDTIRALISGEEQIALLKYLIIQNGTPRTILGHEYASVIGVQQSSALLSAGVVYPLDNIATYYYAKDVGYIQAIANNYSISLRSYHIK